VVEKFTFLGSLLEKEGKCDMAIGKTAMNGLENIWKDKHVSIETKKRLVRALIFPTVLYGCETWTIKRTWRKG
jgi:hypothetical protein